jgi:hypothetical protein
LSDTIALVGDSVNGGGYVNGFSTATTTPFAGLGLIDVGPLHSTVTAGTVYWDAANKTLAYQAGGESDRGPAKKVNFAGRYRLSAASGFLSGASFTVRRSLLPSSDSSFTVLPTNTSAASFGSYTAAQRLNIRSGWAYNLVPYATPSAYADDIAEQIERALTEQAANPSLWLYQGLTNNTGDTTPDVASAKASFIRSMDLMKAHGAPVVVAAIPMRTLTTAGKQAHSEMMHFMRNTVRQYPNAVFSPCWGGTYDPASSTDPLTAVMRETVSPYVHPAQGTADMAGKILLEHVRDAIGRGNPVQFGGPSDAYDAANNASGNLLPNSYLVGSAGTAGTGGAGSFTTGWTGRRIGAGSGTITGSKVARTDGVAGEWQRCSLSGAAGFEQFGMDYGSAGGQGVTTNIVAGSYVQAFMEYNMSAPTDIRQVGLQSTMKNSGGAALHGGYGGAAVTTTAASAFVEAHSGVVATPPVYVPTGTAGMVFLPTLQCGTSGAANIDIGRVKYRYVPEPVIPG